MQWHSAAETSNLLKTLAVIQKSSLQKTLGPVSFVRCEDEAPNKNKCDRSR